jgi:hypothetical protein
MSHQSYNFALIEIGLKSQTLKKVEIFRQEFVRSWEQPEDVSWLYLLFISVMTGRKCFNVSRPVDSISQKSVNFAVIGPFCTLILTFHLTKRKGKYSCLRPPGSHQVAPPSPFPRTRCIWREEDVTLHIYVYRGIYRVPRLKMCWILSVHLHDAVRRCRHLFHLFLLPLRAYQFIFNKLSYCEILNRIRF